MTDPTVPAEHPWRRYVAIGDSFTEGMVDADPRHEGRFIGWADRLAAELAGRTGGEELHYANLAIRGRKLDDVVGRQLNEAMTMAPDLVSIVGGGNDILRPKVDLDAIGDNVRALAESMEDSALSMERRLTGNDQRLLSIGVPIGVAVFAESSIFAVIALLIGGLGATVVAGHESEVLRFTVGVTAVSQIVFFSALVPSVLATRIPVNVGQLVVLWFVRVVLTILIAAPLAHLLL